MCILAKWMCEKGFVPIATVACRIRLVFKPKNLPRVIVLVSESKLLRLAKKKKKPKTTIESLILAINSNSKLIIFNVKMEHPSRKIRLGQAIEWLEVNPSEKSFTAARIYNLDPSSLRMDIVRHKRKPRVQPIYEDHNKILSEAQSKIVIQYIRDQAESELGPTKQIIFIVISHLKVGKESLKPPLSRR